MEDLYNRAIVLFNQQRYADAEKSLQPLLHSDANNPAYLSLLAEIKLHQNEAEKANMLIDSAISQNPDADNLYFQKAIIVLDLDQYDEAEKIIDQAIKLNPESAAYFALWASIKLERKQYQKALELADKALELDAENLHALNTRSKTLIKLNRKEDAYHTIEGALREDPNNPYTHTNYGWNLLEKGEHKKALNHFREALRQDPNFSYAQGGMMEALKASNIIYKLFLKYVFFIQNLTKKYQWGVIIGFFVLYQLINSVASHNEFLQPLLRPVLLVMAIFAFSTWVMQPISNLFLRFNKYGQHLLNKQEKISSNFVAISFFLFLAAIAALLITGHDFFILIAAYGFSMMMPLSVMLTPTKKKYWLIIYTLALALCGIGAIYLTLITVKTFNPLTTIYLVGLFLFQFVVNWVLIQESNK